MLKRAMMPSSSDALWLTEILKKASNTMSKDKNFEPAHHKRKQRPTPGKLSCSANWARYCHAMLTAGTHGARGKMRCANGLAISRSGLKAVTVTGSTF
jgi:hypothetical protein